MKPEQTTDEWLEEYVPGYSQLPSANSIMNDEGEYVEFDEGYFAQDDEYIELCNNRDDEDDFNFDDFLSDTWGHESTEDDEDSDWVNDFLED